MATESVPSSSVSVEFLPDGATPTVSSKDLAHHFGKKHQHILRDIERIRSMVPKSFYESNFGRMVETVAIGCGATRQDPAFRLTRDAFSLLAMGFTGAAAIRWKLKYIEAFNALEAGALENARQAALEEGRAEGKTLALIEGQREARAEGAQTALALTPSEREQLQKVVAYYRRGLTQTEVAKLMDLHRIRVGILATTARRMGLLPPAKQAARGAAASKKQGARS